MARMLIREFTSHFCDENSQAISTRYEKVDALTASFALFVGEYLEPAVSCMDPSGARFERLRGEFAAQMNGPQVVPGMDAGLRGI